MASKQTPKNPERTLRYETVQQIKPSPVTEFVPKSTADFSSFAFAGNFDTSPTTTTERDLISFLDFSDITEKEDITEKSFVFDFTTTTPRPSISPFEAAIKALKSSLVKSELEQVESMSPQLPILTNDANPFRQHDFGLQDQSNLDTDGEIAGGDTENMLNAFEEIFDQFDSKTERQSTSETPTTASVFGFVSVTSVTESSNFDMIESDVLNNITPLNETNNYLSEKDNRALDDFNLQESVTNAILENSFHMISEKDERKTFNTPIEVTTEQMEESTTRYHEILESEGIGRSLPDSFSRLEGNFDVGLDRVDHNQNLATKVMSNGVKVIVAGK